VVPVNPGNVAALPAFQCKSRSHGASNASIAIPLSTGGPLCSPSLAEQDTAESLCFIGRPMTALNHEPYRGRLTNFPHKYGRIAYHRHAHSTLGPAPAPETRILAPYRDHPSQVSRDSLRHSCPEPSETVGGPARRRNDPDDRRCPPQPRSRAHWSPTHAQVESPAVCGLPARFLREDFQHLVMRIICICEHFAGCET